jgi:hypothetical protein
MSLVRSAEAVHQSGRKFLIVAAVLVGKNAFAKENKYSTDPMMKQASNGRKECPHAEVAVLKGITDKDIRGPMLVLRENKRGQLTLAKPCKFCHEYMFSNFPKLNIFYSGQNGEILKLHRDDVPEEDTPHGV